MVERAENSALIDCSVMVERAESSVQIDCPVLVASVVTAVMAVDQRELAVAVKFHQFVELVAHCCGFVLVLG